MAGIDSIEAKLQGLTEFQAKAQEIAVDGLMEEKEVAIDMVFEEQLFMQGINGANAPIMDYKPYTPFTIDIKKFKGQPTDRVTLRDTGDFHSAGYLNRLSPTEAEMGSEDPKTPDLVDKYDRRIFWLTPENLQELKDFYIKPFMQNKIREI